MCNACGFMCCAYDGFSGCGCDDCPNPACWSDDEDDSDDEDGFGEYECLQPSPSFRCHIPAGLSALQEREG